MGEKDDLAKHRGVGGSENTLYDVTTMNMCHYRFIQTHRVYIMKSE